MADAGWSKLPTLLLTFLAIVDRSALQRIQQRLGQRGMTLAEFRLIGTLLEERAGLTQRELAERLQITPASLSVLVSRLEKKRLVTRTVDPRDARIARVCCTSRIAEYAWVEDMVADVERLATEGISAADLEVARSVLGTMIYNLESD